jgi:4-hydroxy-3-methylbut-2-en-1-yl diphosphate synthase IspG/GcpE
MHVLPVRKETDAMFPIALLATPAAAVGVAGVTLHDTGMQTFGAVATAVTLGALALLWRVIQRSIRQSLADIVRAEVSKLVDEAAVTRRRVENLERRVDRDEHG